MRTIKFVVLLSLLVSILADNKLRSCTCEDDITIIEEVLDVDSVFVGRVYKIDRNKSAFITVHLCVEAVWKGKRVDHIKLKTKKHTSDCGFNFEEGEMYMVWAKNKEDSLWVDACSRTKLNENANQDKLDLPFPPYIVGECPNNNLVTNI